MFVLRYAASPCYAGSAQMRFVTGLSMKESTNFNNRACGYRRRVE